MNIITRTVTVSAVFIIAAAVAAGGAFAQEAGVNNLSYPVILPENATPAGFPAPNVWTFATITNAEIVCTTGVPAGTAVPSDVPCYLESGGQVWWLQQRQALGNLWKAFSVAPLPGSGIVDVTAVDVGDLLESAISIKAKQVRAEFALLQNASLDARFSVYIPASYPVTFDPATLTFDQAPCVAPTATTEVGCFAALPMSGAVPGTEQSINEIQGTSFGINTSTGVAGHPSAKGRLIDPATVKPNNEGIPVHSTVYSKCGRLIIQKITDPNNLAWSSDVDDGTGRGGYWVGGALPPQVNIAAWDNSYSAELNASGSLIYGYNWNTKLIPANIRSGTWRLTFALEGGLATAGKCSVALNSAFGTTVPVNVGAQNPSVVLTPAQMVAIGAHHGEGGLVYVDVPLK